MIRTAIVVGQLAARHGIRVSLKQSPYGATTAIVILPHDIIVSAGDVQADPSPGVPFVRAGPVPCGAVPRAHQARNLSRAEDGTVTAAQLRNSMTDQLRGWDGEPLPSSSDAALRAVPREAFLPGTPLAEAYGSSPVVAHRDKDGVATSSASAPGIAAAMLDQLDVRPGQRILEIGGGTGYNAALLARLTGPGGQVTTIELDRGVAAESGSGSALAPVRRSPSGPPPRPASS